MTIKLKTLAERSADQVKPSCRKSYIEGFMAGQAQAEQSAASRSNTPFTLPKLQCPECHAQQMQLIRYDGWYCRQCNSGPYVVHSSRLEPKTGN